ncbi:MAG TPA: YlxR family protein [Nakamurella sp.]
MRTCIGCRRRQRATDLLRVVAVDGVLIPDPRHRLPGRGAWLHPDPGCLDTAERRRAFGRALRVSEHLDTSKVRQLLDAEEMAGPTDRTDPDTGPARSPKPDRQAAWNRKQVDQT